MDSGYATLVANTVTTITLDRGYDEIEVMNLTGSAAVYYTLNGSTPTVKGAKTFCLPAAIGSKTVHLRDAVPGTATVVKAISAGTPEIYVEGQ